MPYGPFLAHDGKWFVLAITHQFWPKACEALGRPEWMQDPRFATEALRQKHESELNRLVGAAMGQQDAAVWQERFVALGIPGATVLGIRDAFAHPQAVARRMLQGFGGPHPIARAVQVAQQAEGLAVVLAHLVFHVAHAGVGHGQFGQLAV
eukprot:gene19972-biopygen17555